MIDKKQVTLVNSIFTHSEKVNIIITNLVFSLSMTQKKRQNNCEIDDSRVQNTIFTGRKNDYKNFLLALLSHSGQVMIC
jgi:hypothetical protein